MVEIPGEQVAVMLPAAVEAEERLSTSDPEIDMSSAPDG